MPPKFLQRQPDQRVVLPGLSETESINALLGARRGEDGAVGPPGEADKTFLSRADAIAETITTDKMSIISGSNVLDFIRDASGTAITTAGGLTWSPAGEPTLEHFDGDFEALNNWIAAQSNRKGALIEGTNDITDPIRYRSVRSISWRGTTASSNLIQPGSQVRYRNTGGKSVTCTSATAANPAVFTAAAHGLVNGDEVWAQDVSGGTWQAELSHGPWTVASATTNTFTLTDSAAAAFNSTGLGTLASVTFKTPGAVAGWVMSGCYNHVFEGLVLRARSGPNNVIRLTADNYVAGTELSGTMAEFSGVTVIPYVDDVADAGVLVENYKHVTFTHSWLQEGVDRKPVFRVGSNRLKSPNTLMSGNASNIEFEQCFIVGDVVLENAYCVGFRQTEFDATAQPVRLRPPSSATDVGPITGFDLSTSFLGNDGGADASTDAAIEQPENSYSSTVILPTSGWRLSSSIIRDWPVAIWLKSGWASLQSMVFRAHDANSVAVVIGERAVGDSIDHTNYFLNHLRTGAIGIRDDRYKSFSVTGITLANPAVVTTSESHSYQNGDRVRLSNVSGMTEVDNREFIVQGVTSTTFQLYSLDDCGATSAAINSTLYAPFSSGTGTVKRPHQWHRQSIGGTALSLGHGAMIFDLCVDETTALTTGTTNVLNMSNVPVTGGRYRITYGGVVDMRSATGAVSFAVMVNGVTVPESQHSFDHQGAADTEIPVFFSRVVPLAAHQSTSGTTIRFRITAPGTINVRGRRSGSLGQFFCQIERVA